MANTNTAGKAAPVAAPGQIVVDASPGVVTTTAAPRRVSRRPSAAKKPVPGKKKR